MRRAQRAYIEAWADLLRPLRPDLSDDGLREFFAMGMLINVMSAIDLLSVPEPWAQNLCEMPDKANAIRSASQALADRNQVDQDANQEVPA